MRTYLSSFFFAILAFTNTCFSQKKQSGTNMWHSLYQQYPSFKDTRIQDRRFPVTVLHEIVQELDAKPLFSVQEAGRSVEDRPIYLVKAGSGKKRVLLWSQMHGDEPTATAAIADIFRFLQQQGDEYDALRKTILDNTTLYFLPMLNPDGAERYQRRNALDIDLNRDALRLVSPESRLLKSIRDSLKADWGFNLHDQNHRYAAGPTGPPATIALLAPPIDDAGTADSVRKPAMQLVVRLNELLQNFIPMGVAKWKDEYEPRAFGENMQRWGTSTVLIESGGFLSDPEKQEIRRLNFVALLAGLHSIATGSWQQADVDAYHQIPENARYYFDLIVRNAQLEKDGYRYKADIAIDRKEKELRQPGQPRFYTEAQVEDIGDLSVFRGFTELDAQGLQLQPGRVYPFAFSNIMQLQVYGIDKLLKEGYTSVMIKDLPMEMNFSTLPINLQAPKTAPPFGLEEPADFVLMQGNQVRYAIINGYVYDVQKGTNGVKNARVKR